jgi:hypothetical protein
LTETIALAGALTVIIVVAALFLRRRPPVDTSDPDAVVLEQLLRAGSDLSKLHEPEFFLYFPLESSAREVAQRLEAEGYTVSVRPGAHNSKSWVCLASKSLILRHVTLVDIRSRLEALAAEFEGEYDGWGTPVVS